MFAILGANGKVGLETCRTLRADGHTVRAIVREIANATELRAIGCGVHVADMGDIDALTRHLRGAQAVQVICPIATSSERVFEEAIRLVDAVAQALEATRPAAVVAISDFGAELDRGSGITFIFHAMERRLERTGLPMTFLRSAEHMENWLRPLAGAAVSGRLASFHAPLTKPFPTISARDVGRLSARRLLAPPPGARPEIVYAEGPRRYSAEEVAEAAASAIGRQITAWDVPRDLWSATFRRGGASEAYAQLLCEMFDLHNADGIDVAGDSPQVLFGSTDIRSVFAAAPALS